ncbi:MAG: alpha/beta hydrolase [Bacteroidales bacterium]|nr:alpha/beta hydrolase [Bacteroidales bacterium]
MKTRLFCLCLLCLFLLPARGAEYRTEKDISYTAKTDAYSRERLKLDIYRPEDARDLPVIVYFHGGGLTRGNKGIPAPLKEQNLVVVAVNYRFLPTVSIDDVIDDAAEAVDWVFRNIARYGGDPAKITVSGHSAGGYLSLMLALDKKRLARYGADPDKVMLYAPLSGQAITHFNVRKEKGLSALQPTIDEYAPLYWVRGDCPPMLLICGDRELEIYGRYDENQYLARMLKLNGNKQVWLYEIGGHGHSPMAKPAWHIVLKKIQELTK